MNSTKISKGSKSNSKSASAPLTPDGWRRIRNAADAQIAAAAKFVLNPSEKKGLYCVFPGVYVRRADVRRFTEARHAASVECGFAAKDFAAVAQAELEDAYGCEEAALTALGLLYHTDRGDGLIYVRAFRTPSIFAAWQSACAAAKVDSRCRPC